MKNTTATRLVNRWARFFVVCVSIQFFIYLWLPGSTVPYDDNILHRISICTTASSHSVGRRYDIDRSSLWEEDLTLYSAQI